MQLIKSVENGLSYSNNFIIRKVSADKSFGQLRTPFKLTSRNFGCFVRFHHEAFTNYVFHAPSLTMGMGSLNSEHREIARKIIGHPDVKTENQENIIGGVLQLWPLGGKKTIISIDHVYGAFGYNDHLKAFEFLVGLANAKSARFSVIKQFSCDSRQGETLHMMIIEDKPTSK